MAAPRVAMQGMGLGTGSIPAWGQLFPLFCLAPEGRRSAGPLLGTVPKGGLSCGGSACLRPLIKEEEEGEDAPGTGPEHRGQPDTGSA